MLLNEGRIQNIQFDSPIFVGKCDVHDGKVERKSFRISLHALRKSDRKTCLLGAQNIYYDSPSEISSTIDPSTLFSSGQVESCRVPSKNTYTFLHDIRNEEIQSIDVAIQQKLRGKIEMTGSDSSQTLSVYITGVKINCISVNVVESDDYLLKEDLPSDGSSWLRKNISLKNFLAKMESWK